MTNSKWDYIVLGALLLAVLIMIIACVCTLFNRVDVNDYTDTVDYQVQSGDTLWNIVKNECFASDDVAQKYDIRDVIALVVSYNNINNGIRPGQWITLPYYTK